MNAPDTLTNSRLRAFDKCRYYHYLSYELGLKPEREPEALRMGTVYHMALEEYDVQCMAGMPPTDAVAYVEGCIRKHYATVPSWVCDKAALWKWQCERETLCALFAGHVRRWADDGIVVVVTEFEFEVDVRNPDTGAKTPLFKRRGKIDRVIVLPDGRRAMQEYKTTSQDIDSGASYWMGLLIDNQVSGYYEAMGPGENVDCILYDVTRKPTKRPHKATSLEARKYTKEGKLYANQREADEAPAEWGERLAADIADNPDAYYQRREVPRLADDVRRYQQDLWIKMQLLRQCQLNDTWDRNPHACILFGKPCQYFAHCSGGAKLDRGSEPPPGFVYGPIHPELSAAADVA